MTLQQELIKTEGQLSELIGTIRDLTKTRLELQNKVDALKKNIKDNLSVEQQASAMIQGHSKETLRAIWNEYLYVRKDYTIAGKIKIIDLEGAQKDDLLFYTMLKEVGGALLTEAFGDIMDFTVDENGEKRYHCAITRKMKNAKNKFNRRIRKTPIAEAFKPYASIVNLVSKHELD